MSDLFDKIGAGQDSQGGGDLFDQIGKVGLLDAAEALRADAVKIRRAQAPRVTDALSHPLDPNWQPDREFSKTDSRALTGPSATDAMVDTFMREKDMTPGERTRSRERFSREAGQIAENTRNMGDRSYLGASAISGIQSAAGVTAGLINEVVGVNDQDLAEAFKDRPQELEQIRNGLGSIFARRAREYGQASRDTMEQVAPDQQEQYRYLKYDTLDPEKTAYLSPVRILGDAIQSLPTTAALALTAYLTKGAASKGEAAALAEGASAEAARQAGINAAASMAARFGAASEGVIGAEQQRESTQAQVMTMDFEKSPAYHDLLKQGYSPETAKLFLAARAGNEAGLDAGVIDAATNLVGGQVLGKIIGEGGSILKRTAKGVANEGITELVQSGGEQLAQNAAQQKVDPNQSLVDGVLESSLQGLVVGGLTGGSAAAAFGRKEQPGIVESASAEASPPTEEDITSPIPTDIIQKGKVELAAVMAKNSVNDILTAAGLPGVGERVTLTKPDGSQHVGTLTDVFEGDEDAPGTGVKLAMDDGTTFNEYLDTLRDAKYTLGRFKDASEEDITADMQAPAPAQVDFILPAQGRVTSPFGHRTAPTAGASTDHGGVDIAVPVGTPIGATAGGTVFATGSGGKRGNWIEIDHGNGLHSRYFHLDSIDVEKGDAVGQGDIIGKSGATGNVTGPHLHWNVLKNGTPIDPMTAGLKGPGSVPSGTSDGTSGTAEQRPNIFDEPLIANRQETAQPEALPPIPEEPATSQIEPLNSTTPPVPAPTFKDTPSGKGFVLGGATAEQIAEIKRQLPNVDMVPNNRGEITFSKKREGVVRETIDRMTASTVLADSSQDSSQQPTGDGTRAAPIVVTHEDHMEPLMDRVNTEPSEAQKEAGNYTKGHVQVQGIDITIENPKGSERSGVDPDGKPWSVKMPNHYGYVKRTTGADAENVDVYIGPEPQAPMVYVVDQNHSETGKFDEHKAMIGYTSQAEAEAAYKAGFSDGKGAQRMGAVVPMHVNGFKEWLKTEPQKPASEAVQPDMLGGASMTESQLAARDSAQGAIDAAREEDDASDALILKTLDHIEAGLNDKRGSPLDPSHYVDSDAPEAIVHAVRKNKASIAAIRAALGQKAAPEIDYDTFEEGDLGPSQKEYEARNYKRDVAERTAEERFPGERKQDAIKRADFVRKEMGEKTPAEITRENLSKQPGAQKRAAENEARTMRDWSNTQIPNYEDRQRSDGDGGATKEAFLKDGKDYANAVASILSDRGFSAPIIKAKSSKGSDKPGKPVRVNEGGPAVSGDVILEMYRPDGSGVYMDIGAALAGPNGGISIMARYVQRGVSQSGPNQWLDDKRLSAKAMADKLEKIADQAPKRQPTNQEMLKAAQDSGRLEIIGIGGKTGEEGKVALDQAAKAARKRVAQEVEEKAAPLPDFAGAVQTDQLTNEEVDQVAAIFDKAERAVEAKRGDRVSFTTPKDGVKEGKVTRVRDNGSGRTVYDIDVDGGGLQNAFADETTILPPKAEKKKAGYGESNTLVKIDRAEEIRRKLREKRNNLNSGIDPETLALFTELGVFHLEAGVRKFTDFARTIASDVGFTLREARPFLRAAYNGARDLMEDSGVSIEGMDSAYVVSEEMGRFDVWAVLENDNADQGSLRAGDAGAGSENVQRDEPDRSAPSTPSGEGGGSERDVRPDNREPAEVIKRDSAGYGSTTRGGTAGAGGTDRVSEQDSTGRGRRDDSTASDAKRVTGQNWLIEPGSLDEARGAALKARDNLRAVEIVKELDRTGAPATREQQEALAKYVGWGGLKNAFNETDGEFPKGFETIGPRLKELLTQEEYDTARRSIQYAHYTAEKVVRPMWDAAVRLGFKGGRVFEPGMGTGNFLGMMPPEIAANTQYAGLEFDYITARIAQLLYPQSGIQHADFTKVPLAKNAYDLVIGNPPFSGTVIRSDPEYGKLGFVLHDFFFAKSIDAVRPGGMLMFVTSAGTMNKVGSEARQYLADRADLVGAVRLAGDAFKENAGTEVTTDIVVLRKRLPGEAPGNMDWVETVNKELPNRDGGKTTGSVSRYFEQHPDMVLGEEGFFDKLQAGERYAVRARPGQDTGKELQRALESLGSAKMIDWQTEQAEQGTDFDSDEHKDGSYYLKDDILYQQNGGVGVPIKGRGKGVKGGISAKDQLVIRSLIPIRDALRDVFKHDLANNAEKATAARKVLNREYDRFVQKYGPINKEEISSRRPTVIEQESERNEAREEFRMQGGFFDEGSFDPSEMIANKAKLAEIAAARREAKETAAALGREWDEGTFDPEELPDVVTIKRPNIDPFRDDQENYRLRAIEHYDEKTGQAKKGHIFVENIISKERPPAIDSPQDALLYVLNKRGHPDLDQIASLAKVSRGQVIEALGDHIFKVPGQGETYQTRELYLSGNVRKKLEIAKAAAERDSSLERNVEALEAVQPTPLGPSDISANLGMPWIPGNIIEDFGRELGLSRLTAKYSSYTAQWRVEGDNNSAAARSEWGTADRGAIELLNAALNRTEVKVYTKVIDPQTGAKRDVIDPEATQAAQDKVLQLKEKFANWIWSDPARADMLAGIYNRDYNNLVAPVYDGSYLTTPGIDSRWNWRPHQTRVIARIIQSGNTYMAHAVGAGKTSAMIGAGMEMRRLGLVRKPMYVVPNHMLGQFTKEFYEQYPTARIMVADERQFHTDRRKQFIANVAANDLDAVIITHSSFGYIPMSNEFTTRMVKERVDEFRDILRELKSEGGAGDRFTQRNIEKQIENLEQKLSGKGKGKKRDQVFTFEEMGVDFLFIDEAHLFRKLDFATKMNNVRGIDPKGSDMSFDLFAKTRYLESINPMRSHVMASGTPVTNTMAELYSLSRYQQSQELKDRGIDQFDAWAGAFGDTVTALEQDPAGGYKPQTRFAKFVNVPELSTMVRQVMDIVTSKQLEKFVVRPELVGKKRQIVLAEPGHDLVNFQENLKLRMDAISKRKGPARKGDDILLSVIGDGRKAAIDMRLVDAGLSLDEGSKLELLISNVSRIAKETQKKGFHKVKKGNTPEGDGYDTEPYRYGPATQMIFSDLGLNGDFPIHKYIANQLIARGLKKSEVAIISDYKSHVARQRLFNDMNEGKVRVLIGSVPKMGTGVNAQRQLYAIHNLDPQWYPANDEQRNGRGLRQGNENPEIEIIDYATKGTYDSQMWQLMETKARFIEGFFNGDSTMRSMEDLGEASQYEQAKALTTADPRIMEMTQYKQDLERAMLRKGAHEREQFAMRTRIAAAKDTIRSNEAKLPFLAKDIEQRQDISGDAFKATVMGQEFDERAAWGEAVKERVDSLVEQEKEGRSQKVGEIGGFALTADIVKIGRDWLSGIHMNFNGDRQEQVSASTPAGIATSIGNMLRNIEGRGEKAQLAIDQAEKQIADFTPQIGKPFTGQAEIDDLKSKVDAIEAVLTAEAKAKEAGPKPQDSRSGADRPVTKAEVDAVRIQLKAELKRLDPMGRVSMSVVDQIEPGISGRYWPLEARIAVSVSADRPPVFSLGHEFVHHLRGMGFYTPSEWRALTDYITGPNGEKIMKSVRQRYPDKDAQAKIEEGIADLFGERLWTMRDGGFVSRAMLKMHDFLTALYNSLTGKSNAIRNIFLKMESGEIASRKPGLAGIGVIKDSIVGGSSAAPDPDGHRFEDAETEKRFRSASQGLGDGNTLIQRAKLELSVIRDKMTRHWVALPNVPKYAALQQKLRALEAAPQAAKERAVQMLREMVEGFSQQELDLFTRKVVLDDLSWEVQSEHELPFGLTAETLLIEKEKIDKIINRSPKLRVAVLRRKFVNEKIAQELVDAGVLSADRMKNPSYFRHQVLDYARAQQRLAASGKKKLRSPRWAKRMGSSLDINANLLEAEFDWLAKALTDIPVARTIDWIKESEHNILPRLRAEARANIKSAVAEKLDAAQLTLKDTRSSESEKVRAAVLIEREKGFRVAIARGLSQIKSALESGDLVPPREFEKAAWALETNGDDPATFRFISWILDNEAPGAMGAASVMKAISQRRAWHKDILGKDFIDPMDATALAKHLAPEGYTTWQPDEGKLLFTVKTLPEHVIDNMIEAISRTPSFDASNLLPSLEQARNALAVGGDKYSMILPQEVADTLNALRREDVEGLLGDMMAVPLRAWKRWVLINPRRIIKYNLNNLSGDLDAVIAGNPNLLRHTAKAARELASVMRGKASPSARYEEAVARGVFDSGLSVQEIPDINQLSEFERLAEPKSNRPDKLAVAGLSATWRALQGFTQWRENVFRYAAYLDYVERIEAGESMKSIGYGASLPPMVDAVSDPQDKAALLARDLIGDYGAISEGGSWLRSHIIPFWSWTEINTKRYWRLTANAYSQGVGKGIATGGGLALVKGTRASAYLLLRMAALFAAINLWNWLMFDDEEEELSELQQRQLHIILGRDPNGEIITLRTQGALSDALSWLGYSDAMGAFQNYEAGRGSIGDVIAAPFKTPVNKVLGGLAPTITLPIESATGKKLWPDWFDTRVNRDPWRNVFSTFSLENEYDFATAQPTRGYARSWVDGVVYRRDPGEIAYDEARGIAYDWLEEVKGQAGASSFSTPRSEATRDFKQALRFDDQDAAKRAAREMISLGMDDDDLDKSIARSSPLGPIPKKDQRRFVESLTKEEIKKFKRAEAWYEKTFAR